MIQTLAQKTPQESYLKKLYHIVSNILDFFDSVPVREPVQITFKSPNINPWKFQTILENHVIRCYFLGHFFFLKENDNKLDFFACISIFSI